MSIKAQKTVINTVDTPVNDQATSGYMDIGDMIVEAIEHKYKKELQDI